MPDYSYSSSYDCDASKLALYQRREFWRRNSAIFIGLCFPLALSAAWLWIPELSLGSGFAAGLVFTYLVLASKGLRIAQRVAAHYHNKRITYNLDTLGIEITTPDSTSHSSWRSIQSIRICKDYILLSSRLSTQPLIIPSSVFNAEALSFMLTCVRDNGGHTFAA